MTGKDPPRVEGARSLLPVDRGARRPDQLDPIGEVMGWHLSREDREQIVRMVDETIVDPVGPEFMAPPARAINWRHDAPLTRRIHANG